MIYIIDIMSIGRIFEWKTEGDKSKAARSSGRERHTAELYRGHTGADTVLREQDFTAGGKGE